MSIKDELERASNEKNAEAKQHALRVIQTQKILKEKLDFVFSRLSQEIRSRNEFYVDSLIATKALTFLSELRQEGNLIYANIHHYEERRDFWGRAKQSRVEMVPAVLEVSLIEQWVKGYHVEDNDFLFKPILRGCVIYSQSLRNPDLSINLHSALSDLSEENNRIWNYLNSTDWDILEDFPKAIRDFETALNALGFPPLQVFVLNLHGIMKAIMMNIMAKQKNMIVLV